MAFDVSNDLTARDWQETSIDEALALLQSDAGGLASDEVERRLRIVGPNTLPEEPRPSRVLVFLRQFNSPLIYILLIASVISFIVGSVIDAGVILIIVIANAIIGYVQENKAENVLATLKELTALRSTVRRDGTEAEIDARSIVPGDILVLDAGDRIPADARLLFVRSLKADESMLTGESVTVDKRTATHTPNMVYSGTIATEGRGEAVVVRTGIATEFGKIAASVQTTARPETPLQKDLRRLSVWIGILVLVASAIIFVTGTIQGESIVTMFFIAVSQAVSAIPEGLPAVTTVVLTMGVRAMVRERAIVRRLPAVEALGATNIILSDKTGTLTRNEMSVEKLWVGSFATVTGAGYAPTGEVRWEADGRDARGDPSITRLLTALVYANDAQLRANGVTGDPTEAALVVAAKKAGIDKEALERMHPRRDELPFDPELGYMATLNDAVYVKGAPEVLLSMADAVALEGTARPLDDELRGQIHAVIEQLASNGLRVLAAGVAEVPAGGRESAHASEGSLSLLGRSVRGLTFAGLVGMRDPPRPEVKEALALSRAAKIRTVMVTGDNPYTARAIAAQLGIADKTDSVLTSDELSTLTDDELDTAITGTSVFARIRPLDKKRLVDAFKRQQNIVAVTGDGVNDVPALVSADIGVAMGRTGTDVAKEAADMVLTDDNYATIVTAIREGRRIYANLRKVLLYLLATNIGELVFIFTAINIGLPLPLTPVQILWVNLVTDGICVIPLGLEPEEEDVMTYGPRRANEHIISPLMVRRIVFMAIIIAAGTLLLFYETLRSGVSIEEAQTTAFVTVALFQLVNVFNCKSTASILHARFFTNRYLVGAVALAFMLQLATVYVPFLQIVFRTVPLSPDRLGVVLLTCFSILVLEEARKWVASKWGRSPREHS
ncbi:MAG: cation-translocating P-type ATPase [Halobacteriota archaeon]